MTTEVISQQIVEPIKVDLISSLDSFMIASHLIPKTMFTDYDNIPKFKQRISMYYNSDIWISGYVAKQGIPKFIIPSATTNLVAPFNFSGREETANEALTYWPASVWGC